METKIVVMIAKANLGGKSRNKTRRHGKEKVKTETLKTNTE